ncbi:MAG: nitroreductase family protein [Candidatus Woesearchaeota archaeon]
MAIDAFKAIFSRRSYRKFKRKTVPRDLLFFLVEAGMKAPSAGNLQEFSFIVTTDKKIINQLPELCMDQAWISTAPAVIVVCSQPHKLAEWYGERGRHVFAIQDAAAATQNILLAAHASGLGACWIGGFDQEKIDGLFKTEGKARVETIIPVGYPNEKPAPKHEKGIELMMYFDTYGNNKPDKVLLNKDYSIKLEQQLEKAEEKAQSFTDRAKIFVTDVAKKFKEKQK